MPEFTSEKAKKIFFLKITLLKFYLWICSLAVGFSALQRK